MKKNIKPTPRWIYLLIAIHYLLSLGTFSGQYFGRTIANTIMIFWLIYGSMYSRVPAAFSLVVIVGTLAL